MSESQTYTVETSSAINGSDRRTHTFANATDAWAFVREVDRSDDRLAGFPMPTLARRHGNVI